MSIRYMPKRGAQVLENHVLNAGGTAGDRTDSSRPGIFIVFRDGAIFLCEAKNVVRS